MAYNASKGPTGDAQRRAYYLLANEERVVRGKKPHFVDVPESTLLKPVPLLESAHGNPPEPPYAILATQENTTGFRLRRSDTTDDTYLLPVYPGGPHALERVILTPFTAVADIGVQIVYGVGWLLEHGVTIW